MPAGLSLHTALPPVLLWRPAEDWFGPEEESDVLSADFFPSSIKKGVTMTQAIPKDEGAGERMTLSERELRLTDAYWRAGTERPFKKMVPY